MKKWNIAGRPSKLEVSHQINVINPILSLVVYVLAMSS